MAMDIGDAKLTIKADDKTKTAFNSVDKSTKNMSANFKKAGLAMAAMGAALIFTLGKMVNSYSKAGDEVAKMAKRTGFGTEALSELRHVANITGADLGTIEKAIKKMSKTIIDAGDGMTTYVRAFEKIGIEVEDLRSLSPEEQFWTIARAIGDLTDDTLKAAVAQDMFGRAGTALLPMMAESGEAIAALRQEAHDLGIVFTEEAAAAAEAFEDAKTRLKTAFQGITNAVAETIMPKLTEFIELIVEKMQPAIAWLKEHPEVIEAFIKFGLLIGAGGAVFVAVGYFVKALATLKVMLMAIKWELYAIVGALIYVALGFAAIARGRWPTWHNILLEAKAVGKELGKLILALSGLSGEGIEREYPPPPVGYTSWEHAIGAGFAPPPGYKPPIEGPLYPPSMQYGGIVPGPIGRPVPIIAHGGEAFGGVGGRLGNTIINVNVEGSVVSERELIDVLRREFILEKERNTTTGF